MVMRKTSMFRDPWEKKVWAFIAIAEVYLVIQLGVLLIE